MALENQIGLPTTAIQRKSLSLGTTCIDLRERPARYFEGSARLAEPMLCMLDRVYFSETANGVQQLRAEKDVDPAEWFFKAHFFQDPVQPGSLGIEAMIQLLQFYMLQTNMDKELTQPRFQPLALDREVIWKYRGQVLPENRLISTTIEVIEQGRDSMGIYAIANASLWVDGKRIYEAEGLGMRLVEAK